MNNAFEAHRKQAKFAFLDSPKAHTTPNLSTASGMMPLPSDCCTF